MKIFLISLPSPFAEEPAMNPPLGLCYLSSSLKHNGYTDIQVLDYSTKVYDYWEKTDYLKEISLDADYYAISALSSQFLWLKQVIAYIKENNPKGKIMVGGPHASTCPEECLKIGADIAIKGEGEQATVDVVMGKALEFIPGACFINENGVFHEGKRAYISDLDSLPIPDRDIFDLNNYKRKINDDKAIHIVTLRGCPYNCSFCDKETVGCNVRYHSVEYVLNEIDFIIEKYGIRSFVIYDDIFTLNKSRTERFCEEFRKRDIKWRCWSRVDTLDRDILLAMKNSGLTSITLGVESGDDTVLKNINKASTAEKNRQALLLCKELNIPVRCSLMYGNPGENIESIRNTVRLIEETQPDEWNLAILSPVPGSDIWNNPEKYGVIFEKQWVIDNNYSMINRFGNSGVGTIYIDLKHLKKGEFAENLKYFISELERVCPRKKIQDTIQKIEINMIK